MTFVIGEKEATTGLKTFGGIVEEVLFFGFNDGPQVNKKRIENWVNEAQFQIVRQVEASEFQATEEIKLVQGKYKYTLPEGFFRVQDIYYPEEYTRLRPVDLQQFDTTAPKTVEGPPRIYTIYSNELWVFPNPNSSGEILEMRYIESPAGMVNSTDIPSINQNYLWLLVEYALMKAFAAEDDAEASAEHQKMFKEGLAAYATDMQYQIVDRPRVLDGSWGNSAYGGRII